MFPVTYEVKETQVTVPAANPKSSPTVKTIKYAVCTIQPLDRQAILEAFHIDVSAKYSQFDLTCGEAIDNMALSLKQTMYGTAKNSSAPPMDSAESNEILANLTCSQKRRELMTAAFSLVRKVPYFWGGKSGVGWNIAWNTPKLVTSTGSSTTNTIIPYGLDCTGFTDWVYNTALGVHIGDGRWNQWANSTAVTKEQLLLGDLGFIGQPGTVSLNHVLLYVGTDSDGKLVWVHCEYSFGVHSSSPNYVKFYRRTNAVDWGAD